MENMKNMQIISLSVFHFLRKNIFLFLTFPPFPFLFFFSSTKKRSPNIFLLFLLHYYSPQQKNSFLLFLLLHENIFSFSKYFPLFLPPSFLRDIDYNRPIHTVILSHINHQLANLSSPIWSSFIFLGLLLVL